MTKDKQTNDMAKERTQWAEDRTILSNERTFSSRMGFALGCLGVALGLQGVFSEVEPTWLAKLAATIFVLLAFYIALVSYRSTKKMLVRLNSHSAEPSSGPELLVVTIFICIGSIATGAVLWIS